MKTASLLLYAGQVQLMQVKPAQGRLQHPAALGSFGHKVWPLGRRGAVGIQI